MFGYNMFEWINPTSLVWGKQSPQSLKTHGEVWTLLDMVRSVKITSQIQSTFSEIRKIVWMFDIVKGAIGRLQQLN